MCPCSEDDLTITEPDGPSGPSIPGFGSPFAPSLPNFANPFPSGFPEDLLELLDLLKLILPPGSLKGPLNPNFGKDVFDTIMKILDQFMPFLMLYKFFLPILELIICIIEVLCAIANPFKLIKALKRLFRVCLPDFLALFPIFALILMLISLLLLILALIEYIIAQILKLINLLLRNIKMIVKATTKADAPSILAATKKIGMVLCGFQNFFVLLAIFKTILDVIKEILKLLFNIPPCDDGDNGNGEKCCTPEVCPSFIKNNDNMTHDTGTLQYYNEASQDANLSSLLPSLPAGFLTNVARKETWQFYDSASKISDAFINITNAFDLPEGVTQVFFPMDATYSGGTSPNQAPYLVDLRLFYDPKNWKNPAGTGQRLDVKGKRFIRINDCIVLNAPTTSLLNYKNSVVNITNGVLNLSGGRVTEDDGLTQVFIDGKTATLDNFIHLPAISSHDAPVLSSTDGHLFSNITYVFKINHEVLLGKNLITLGCIPDVALDRTFINAVFGGNAGVNFTLLNNLALPDVGAAQTCLTTALSVLRSNISEIGVANFQAATTICLNKLKDDTSAAVNNLLGIGFDQYKSTFTIDPAIQFTTQTIKVQVTLKEANGTILTTNLPPSVSDDIAKRITASITFGTITNFSYDGSEFFIAEISSRKEGAGSIEISFDHKLFSTAIVPTDLSIPPSIVPQKLDYQFVFSTTADGKVRRDDTDVAGDILPGSDGG